jgi:hypothetical protein
MASAVQLPRHGLAPQQLVQSLDEVRGVPRVESHRRPQLGNVVVGALRARQHAGFPQGVYDRYGSVIWDWFLRGTTQAVENEPHREREGVLAQRSASQTKVVPLKVLQT